MKSKILSFVESLFEPFKIPNVQGIFLEMPDTNWEVKLVEKEEKEEKYNKVAVMINGVDMGYFEFIDSCGYEYRFMQKYRQGIRKGYTVSETIMKESICNKENILFSEA